MAGAQEMLSQAFDLLKGLSKMQKIIAGLLVGAIALGLLSLTFVSSKPDMRVLFSNLEAGDAGDIVNKLDELRVKYELAENGTAIMVPASAVYKTRLDLAGAGLPRGGGVGFELFDKTSFGTTDFVQRLNFQRATQGELARTISQFKKIKSARVHIAQPKESVFVEDSRPPSASISVALTGRGKLQKEQIRAIVNLVASAVPGLTEDNITLVDTAGHLLFRKDGDEDSLLSATQLEYQQKIERNMRQKLESMFEEVVGVNKVIARVNAVVDFDHLDSSEEIFDPETQVVRSEQLLTERDGAASDQGGIPGVKGQLATYTANGEDNGNNAGFKRDNITKNYEISKKMTHKKAAVGTITKLTVAIMVDGIYKEVGEGKERHKQFQPRNNKEIATFIKMAKNAVGYDPERGDQVEVVSMPFYLSSYSEPKVDLIATYGSLLSRLALPVVLLIMALGFIMFVIRPFFRLMASQHEAAQRAADMAEHELEQAESGQEEDLSLTPIGMSDKERIFKLAQSDPDRAADLVRRWLREEM